MTMASFGVGNLTVTPLYDASGTAITNPTPVQVGIIQDVSLDVSFELKKLYGSRQFAEFMGRGQGSVTGKFSNAQINGQLLNLVFGQTTSTGIIGVLDDFSAAIPATPFQVTPTIPGAGTFSADLGVINVTTGRTMTRVASAPATGQYSVAAGVYTFASADTGNSVLISLKYTGTSTTAPKGTVSNLTMGTVPTFSLDWSLPYQGKMITYTLPNITISKLSFAGKNSEFTVPSIDFEAAMDQVSQSVMTWAVSE